MSLYVIYLYIYGIPVERDSQNFRPIVYLLYLLYIYKKILKTKLKNVAFNLFVLKFGEI